MNLKLYLNMIEALVRVYMLLGVPWVDSQVSVSGVGSGVATAVVTGDVVFLLSIIQGAAK